MANPYSLGRKRKHRPGEIESLAIRCMKLGVLDVCLVSGRVYTSFRGIVRERKINVDADGYCGFCLNVESTDRTGKQELRRDTKVKKIRRRHRMYVQLHRLVMAKKLAVEKAGDSRDWRTVVRDIPINFDIDHIDRDRANNRGSNLRLRGWFENRTKVPMTAEEQDRCKAFESDF